MGFSGEARVLDDQRPPSPLAHILKPAQVEDAAARAVGALVAHSMDMGWPPSDLEGLALALAHDCVRLLSHGRALEQLLEVPLKRSG